MLHAKALFLVNDHKTKVRELYRLRQQGVRADDNIYTSIRQIFFGLFRILRRDQTG